MVSSVIIFHAILGCFLAGNNPARKIGTSVFIAHKAPSGIKPEHNCQAPAISDTRQKTMMTRILMATYVKACNLATITLSLS